MSRPLRVVGPEWLAKDLDAIHDSGLEVAQGEYDYWCSGAHYARLKASGVNTSFTTPGGSLPLLKLPQWALRRELRVEKASTILESPPHEDLFSKPNDIKLNDSFPAKVRSREELIHDLQAVSDKYPHYDLDISLSSQIDFIREYRIIVINGKFGMSSIYRDDEGKWGREASDTPYDKLDVRSVSEELIQNLPPMPSSYVIDIGEVDEGEFVAIETNPSASSGWYLNDVNSYYGSIIKKSIRAGQNIDKDYTWNDPIDLFPRVTLPSDS